MSVSPTMPNSPIRFRKRSLLRGALLGLLLALGIEVAYVVLGTNLHAVVAGRCYRSGQLSSRQLEDIVQRLGIRTVINLRGLNENESWFISENKTAERLSLHKLDIALSGYFPSDELELRKLLDAFASAPSPILVHCQSGSDRSGLASALFLLSQTDTDLETARAQLHLRYGRNPFGSAHGPTYMLDAYTAWLADTGQQHTPQLLHHWIFHVYRHPHRPPGDPVEPVKAIKS